MERDHKQNGARGGKEGIRVVIVCLMPPRRAGNCEIAPAENRRGDQEEKVVTHVGDKCLG